MTFAETPDGRARIVPAASDTKLSLPPTGGTVSLVVSGLIAGAAAAKLLHDTTPVAAWLTAAGLCGGIFGLAKLLVRGRPTGMRLVGLLALGCLTFSYLLVLGGESTPRPVRRDALGLLALLTVLLGVVAAATALPLLLIAAALRRDRNAKVPHVSPPASPILITLALGAGTLVVGLVLLAVTIWMAPARWRVPAILTVGLASPVLLLPLWAYIGLVGILAVVLPITILRGSYDTFVIRRHEAEADEFAVDVAGAGALLSALEALLASGQSAALVHNRWTTHGTWEMRAAKIRAYGDSRGRPR